MFNSEQEGYIPFEVALRVADEAVFSQTSRHLKNIEVAVLRGSWNGQSYDQIADTVGYAPEYIKHDVGPKLWKLLSAALGEKVSKTNLMAVLLQQIELRKRPVESLSNTSQNLSLEAPLGPIPLESKFYIERPPAESRCYEEIMRSGALIRIKAPSQMGKTSLMMRILARAKEQLTENRLKFVVLSLQRIDRAACNNLDQFLRWFCASISRKLQIPCQVDDYWTELFGSKSNCTAYFEDCILPEISGVLILAIEQVDEVFLHPEIADDFFTLLRSWYEEAAYGDLGNPLWQKLRLIIVHSTEVYIPLDINKSPFNVGLAIELQSFNFAQMSDLAGRYALNLSESELNKIRELTAGHPYLTQQAFYQLATKSLTLEELIKTAPTDQGIYAHHLHRLLENLVSNPDLAEAYRLVLQSADSVELQQVMAFQLHSMGLVTLQGNRVSPSCELYRSYFSDR